MQNMSRYGIWILLATLCALDLVLGRPVSHLLAVQALYLLTSIGIKPQNSMMFGIIMLLLIGYACFHCYLHDKGRQIEWQIWEHARDYYGWRSASSRMTLVGISRVLVTLILLGSTLTFIMDLHGLAGKRAAEQDITEHRRSVEQQIANYKAQGWRVVIHAYDQHGIPSDWSASK